MCLIGAENAMSLSLLVVDVVVVLGVWGGGGVLGAGGENVVVLVLVVDVNAFVALFKVVNVAVFL